MTAAADIQIAVLNHLPVIASNFRTGGILAVNGGFAVVVCRGVITVNLRVGATVGDGALAFVVNNRLVAVNLDTDDSGSVTVMVPLLSTVALSPVISSRDRRADIQIAVLITFPYYR